MFSEKDKSIVKANRFCRRAMATVFEIFIPHQDSPYAGQAAAAAFDELARLESDFSRFVENSDISRINNLPCGKSLPIAPDTFKCLQLCERIYTETDGAFDITLGSAEKGPRLKLNETQYTVRQPAKAVKIDLGGIGKGYAVDKMAAVLRSWDIDTALLHGGYSSVLALGAPAGTNGWPLTLSSPDNQKQILARIRLRNRAIGGSSLQQGPHIIDPHTAQPVKDTCAAWAAAPDAATADALSTAFMVMGPQQTELYCLNHPGISAILVTKIPDTKQKKILNFGPWKSGEPLKP